MSDQTDHITMIAMVKILLQHSPIPHNLGSSGPPDLHTRLMLIHLGTQQGMCEGQLSV